MPKLKLLEERFDKLGNLYYKCGNRIYLPNNKDPRPSRQHYLWKVRKDKSLQTRLEYDTIKSTKILQKDRNRERI